MEGNDTGSDVDGERQAVAENRNRRTGQVREALPPGWRSIVVSTTTPSSPGFFPYLAPAEFVRYSPRRVPSLPVDSPCLLKFNELACPVVIAWLVNALRLATR